MWIVKLALNRPYTFSVAAILILFLGFTSIATTFSHDRPYAARRCELDIYVHFNTQELATSMLPFGALLAGLQGPINLRLVLTGIGGGTWEVVIGGDAPEPAAIGIVTDVVDFCRLAANRLNPADLDMHVTGDQGRAVGVLAAASALALD